MMAVFVIVDTVAVIVVSVAAVVAQIIVAHEKGKVVIHLFIECFSSKTPLFFDTLNLILK